MRRSNRVLLNDHSCQLIPNLVAVVGNRSTAVILQEIHYWLTSNSSIGVVHSDKKWIYNTYEYISEKTGYSVSAVKLALKSLQNLGLIFIKKLNPVRSIRTNYYTINYDQLNKIIDSSHSPQISESNESSRDKRLSKSQSSTSNHQSLSSQSLATYCPMYNKEQIYLTDTLNKSEHTDHFEGQEVAAQTNTPSSIDTQQVQQVQNLKNDLKEGEGNHQNHTPLTPPNSSESEQKPQNTTTQDMLSIWNATIVKAPTKMTKDLAPHLFSAYKSKFDHDLNKWKTYCHMIASSDYLMGEGFKLSLLWALKFSTIDRILDLELGVKEVAAPEENFKQKALDHIHLVNEPQLCVAVRHKLLKVYGPKTYLSWIKDLSFSMQGDQVRFKAPSLFHESYVARNFAEILK